MNYRDILVHIDAEPTSAASERRRAYAISLAASLRAHLTGVVFAFEPTVPATVMGTLPATYMETQRRASEDAAKRGTETFVKAARTAGIEHEPRIVWAFEGRAPAELASHSRVADLIVLGQPEPSDPLYIRADLIEAALFDSGRPTLVVPYVGYDTVKLDRVLVAWDGGRQAARAVHDALPLLTRAKKVEVVVVGADNAAAESESPGDDLALHLARHGVDVSVKRLTDTGIDPGNILLSHAADFGADFMVMGAYGHARLRQFLLGGTTRTVIESMTIPVLMAH